MRINTLPQSFEYNIRNLYTPIQPAVMGTDGEISYVELAPDAQLQDFIYCYWNLKTNKPLDGIYNYRVVSDGCIDVVFNCTNYDETYIMGYCNSFVKIGIDKEFSYFGVRFLPGIFPLLFNIDASELSNHYEHLNIVQPHLYNAIQQSENECSCLQNLCNELNRYFINHINKTDKLFDNRFFCALETILKSKGLINIEKDLNDGISSRHLQRLFNFYIGDTAKSFCRIVRFQNLLKIDPSIKSIKTEKSFYDFGYYDQTHFIKEFKLFYGKTPSKVAAE